MSTSQISLNTRADGLRLRPLGTACVASGVLGAALGIFTLAYPAAVPKHQWSYPFPTNVQWVIGVILAIAHVLTLAGFLGLLVLRPYRQSRAGDIGIWTPSTDMRR